MKQYYPHYSKEGLPDPPIVKEYTDNYWKSTNIYQIYLSERIENAFNPDGTRDNTCCIGLSQLYSDFKNFLSENYSHSNTVPDRKIASENISSIIGPMSGNKWYGIRFKQRTAFMPQQPTQVNKFGNLILPESSDRNNDILEV
jgi:hypothetical protein